MLGRASARSRVLNAISRTKHTMKIYQAVTSPFAVRVRIAAYAKGLSLEFAAPPDGMGSEAYRKISPLGKVPTLVTDDGTVIAESAVINEYLEDQFPDAPLLPATAVQRARARMVTEMTDAYIFARYLPLFAFAKTHGKESPLVADGMRGVNEGLAAVDRVIDDEAFAIGNDLSLADCALAPALFYITEYAEDYLNAPRALNHCAKLQAYWQRIQVNPHVARALAER